MVLPTWYDTGTVSVANGSASVTGTGTLWGSDAIMAGDLFCDLAQPLIPPQRIASVEGNGALTLAAPWPGTTLTDDPYEIRFVGIIERSTAQTRRVLEQLGEVSAYFDIQVDDTAARLALESVDAPLRANYRVLVSDIGDGSAAIYSKATSAYDDWTEPAPYSGPKGDRGWAPVFGVASDGARRVQQLVGYVGGEGDAPTAHIDEYVGASGYTAIIGDAVDIRGAAGANGAGTVADVIAGPGIAVDSTDPTAPVVSTKLIAAGQCYLTVSAGNLLLLPRDGNQLSIDGDFVEVPSGGVSLAATGKTGGTLYYVYAYLSGGVLTLDAVTTGHSTDSATGIEIKTGDASRTFVGWAVPSAGPTWAVTPAEQLVRSYFNDAGLLGTNALGSNITYAVNDWAELSSGARVQFISRGERVDFGIVGVNYCVTNGKLYGTCVGVDGATPLDGPYVDSSPNVSAGLNWTSIGATWPVYVAEGLHYATIVGRSYDAASVVWRGDASASAARCVLNVVSGKASGGEPVELKLVTGTIRSTAGTWELITTGNHRPVGVASISQDSTTITITYDFTGTNVVGALAGLDDTFATSSVIDKVGASVGLSAATLKLGKIDGSGNTSTVDPSTISDAGGNIWFRFELDR